MIRRGFSLSRKKRRGFLSHLKFFFTFRGKRPSRTQLGIGNWRESRAGLSSTWDCSISTLWY